MIKGLQKLLPEEYHASYAETAEEMTAMYEDWTNEKIAVKQFNNFALVQIAVLRQEVKDLYKLIDSFKKEN